MGTIAPGTPEWLKSVGKLYAHLVIKDLMEDNTLNETNHESVLLDEEIVVTHRGVSYTIKPEYVKHGVVKEQELPETEESNKKFDVFKHISGI